MENVKEENAQRLHAPRTDLDKGFGWFSAVTRSWLAKYSLRCGTPDIKMYLLTRMYVCVWFTALLLCLALLGVFRVVLALGVCVSVQGWAAAACAAAGMCAMSSWRQLHHKEHRQEQLVN